MVRTDWLYDSTIGSYSCPACGFVATKVARTETGMTEIPTVNAHISGKNIASSLREAGKPQEKTSDDEDSIIVYSSSEFRIGR